MSLALVLAWRDLRGDWRASLRGLLIVLACLALGVAAIATVGGLRDAVEGGIAAHGRDILGGDLEIDTGNQPPPDALLAWVRAQGGRWSEIQQLRAMLIAANGERQLVELKAVDAAWPLLGVVRTTPPVTLPAGLVVDPLVLARLGVRRGDIVHLGDAALPITAIIADEPDHAATPSLLGPTVLMAAQSLPATRLVQPGSMVRHRLRVVWPAGADTPALAAALHAAFPHQSWHIRDPRDALPGATRFIDQLAVFMSLVGLASLLVGGIGVATGVRAWLEGRARSIAILRCLGASAPFVFTLSLAQVLVLAIAGIALGVVAGAILPIVALSVLRDALPVPPVLGIYWRPLGQAALFGLLAAGAFALPPLARVMRIPGAALFRDALLPSRGRPPAWLLATELGFAAALVALTILTSPDRRVALGFCVAALVTLGLFRLGASALMVASRALHGVGSATARLGLGNLHRPGNATPLMLMALGLGLSTLASVALIQGNMAVQLQAQLPRRAPSFYFIDIQPDQIDRFRALVGAIPGATDLQMVPSLIARVTAVNGVAVEQLHPTPDTAWAMQGDRQVTYAATPPPGTRVTAGRWWAPAYDGPPLLSFDAGLAKGWGVHIGDTVTVQILGRPIDLRIANLRQIDWRSLGMNFAMVASPGLLSSAPHSNLAAIRVPPAQDGALLRTVTDALPNVTGIRVADILAAVGKVLGQIGTALAATGSLTLASGALVLAGTVASGQRRRIAEAVILKSLGATRGQIRTAWLIEFGALGLAAGVIAALVGSGASFAVMRWVMAADWTPLPGRLALTILGCIVLMLGFGYIGTAAALRSRPGPLLRHE